MDIATFKRSNVRTFKRLGVISRYWTAGVAGVVGLAALAAYLATLAPSITWQAGGADSGELAAAVAGLGVAHPPGYPTYVLLGRAWLALPFGGEPAYRLNLFSATGAATAAGLAGLTTIVLGQRLGYNRPLLALGAGLGGLLLAWAPLTWSQAIITEVYGPGLAGLACLSWLLLRRPGRPRAEFLTGLVAGLGGGLLPQLLLALPGGLVLLVQRGRPGRRLALAGLGGGLGLAVFAYLPLAARAQPLVNWGDPVTPARFWALVTAAPYRPYLGLLGPLDWLNRLAESLVLVGQNLSWAGLILAGLGGYSLWPGQRAALGYLLSLAGLAVLFRAGYPVVGNAAYLLPALYGLAILAGLGLSRLLLLARAHLGRVGPVLLGLACLATLAARTMLLAPRLDLSRDDQAARFGRELLAALPPGAVIVTGRDEATFSLWYQQALGQRPDVLVVDRRLLTFDWYREQLQRRSPDLARPTGRRPVYLVADPFNPTLVPLAVVPFERGR